MLGIYICIFALCMFALFGGLGLGVYITRKGHALFFREHVDEHFFAVNPVASCSFCRMERGNVSESPRHSVNNHAGTIVNKKRPQSVNRLVGA
jgi:hypothetical protein